MQFSLYTNVKEFYKATYDVLMRHEAQNIIPLGNVIIGNAGKDKTGWRDPANWFMATVSDANGICLTAVMTPPKNLTLYATDNKNDPNAITSLIEGITQAKIPIPGVMAEKSLAEMFAQQYTVKYDNLIAKINKSQRIYELSEVSSSIPKINIRPARESDMSFLPYWDAGFYNDCFGEPPTVSGDAETFYHIIRSNRVYIMEDTGIPVTMAKISRDLRTVCAIGYVYTPPYFRKKGYATACVAAISQIGLDRGFSKCVLYTDLANPISNSIYQKIGYRPICDSLEIKLTKKM